MAGACTAGAGDTEGSGEAAACPLYTGNGFTTKTTNWLLIYFTIKISLRVYLDIYGVLVKTFS